MARKETIEIRVNSKDAEKSIDKMGKGVNKAKDGTDDLNNSQKGYNQSVNKGASALDKMTGGAITAFRGIVSGAKAGVRSMMSLRAAVISTGIGALVVAIVSLISYFNKTEKGAQQLRVIMAALGAVVDQLVEVFISLGETIYNAFENPKEAWESFTEALERGYKFVKDQVLGRLKASFDIAVGAIQRSILKMRIAWNEFTGDSEEAESLRAELDEVENKMQEAVRETQRLNEEVVDLWNSATDAVREYAQGIVDAAREAANLEDRQNRLKVLERELGVQRAKTNKEISAARLLAEDETASYEDRIEALKAVMQLETQMADQELAAAREALAIKTAQNALASSGEDALQEEADLKAKVYELEQRSLNLRKRLSTDLERNIREQQAALKAFEKTYNSIFNENAGESALEKRIRERKEFLDAAADEAIRLFGEESEQYLNIIEERNNAEAKITEEFNAEQEAKREADLAKIITETEKFLDSKREKTLESEREAMASEFEQRLEILREQGLEETELYLNLAAEKDRIDAEYQEQIEERNRQRIEREKAMEIAAVRMKLNVVSGFFSAMSGLFEESSKQAKSLAISEVLVNSASAAIGIWKSSTSLPEPWATINRVAQTTALAASAANSIKQINNASMGRGSVGNSIGAVASASTPSVSVVQAAQANTNLQDIADSNRQPIRAYVTAQDVNSASAIERNTIDNAIVG